MKTALTIPLMVTGGFRSADVMNEAIASNKTDLIGMGCPFIIDPAFPEKLLSGAIEGLLRLSEIFRPLTRYPEVRF